MVRSAIGELGQWLGALWLRGLAEHPLRELWYRRDWLATIELFSLGCYLRRIRGKPGADAFLKDKRRHLRGGDRANRSGHLWELCAAGLFDRPGEHPVQPAKRTQPGYDLTLKTQSGDLRLSCKALGQSDREREFRAFAVTFNDLLMGALAQGTNVAMMLARGMNGHAEDLDVEKCLESVIVALSRWDGRSNSAFTFAGWTLALRPQPLSDPSPSARGASCQLIVLSDFQRDEQVRFVRMLTDALQNLDQHCGADPRAVAARVPEPISMKEAAKFAADTLQQDFPKTSGVYLYRNQLITDSPASPGTLGHEFLAVQNPKCALPLPAIRPEAPAGVWCGEPEQSLVAGDEREKLGPCYLFTKTVTYREVRGRAVDPSESVFEWTHGPRFQEDVHYVLLGPYGREQSRASSGSPYPWTLAL